MKGSRHMALDAALRKIKAKGEIYLFVIGPYNYHYVHSHIFSHFANKLKMICIYVSLNEPCVSLLNELKQNSINMKRIYIIDGISGIRKEGPGFENCSFIENTGSLTEMSIMITEAMNSGKFDFIFFDSISTLLMYNEPKVIESFLHFIIGKIRNFHISGAMLILNEGNSKDLIGTVSQFCNKVIKE